jgi:lysophospholipase L1-like esterase
MRAVDRRLSPRTRRLLLAGIGGPVVAALLLVGAEGVCALAGVEARHFFTARRGADGSAEFVKSDDLPVPRAAFRVETFAATPKAGTRRVLCVGDSTCYGHPFEPPAPFPNWIELRLKTLLPDVATEVVNLGSPGLCSENVRDVVEDVGAAGASVVVVYVGHNEYLDRNLLPLVQPFRAAVQRQLRRSRLGTKVDHWLEHPFDSTAFTKDVHATPVHDGPLFSDAQVELGLRRYRDHLADLVAIARAHGAAVVLVHPVADVRDTPVDYSRFADATPRDARARFLATLNELRKLRTELEDAAKLPAPLDESKLAIAYAKLEELVAIDASVALLHYERGRLLLLAGKPAEAEPELELARDSDGYPIRSNPRIHATLDAVARERGALVADPRPAFAAKLAALTVDQPNDWFVDYCHPDLQGHELLADVVLHAMADANLLAPKDRWRFDAEPTREEYRRLAHFDPDMQAESWAKRALMDLGQAAFDARATPMKATERLLERARRLAPRCASAWLGCGVLAAMHGRGDEAVDCFDRVVALDPKGLEPLLSAYEQTPQVRKVLTDASLVVRDGRVKKKAR